MSNSDYILRIIEQISIVIGRIFGLQQEDRLEESQEVLNDALANFFGLNTKLADVLEYPDMITFVSGNEGLNEGKCIALAELLKIKAEMYESQGYHANANNLFIKSINLYIEALLIDNDLCSGQNISKIDGIIKKTEAYQIPEESKQLLFQYYELTRRYDKAEDTLYDMLELKQYESNIINSGIAFYQRMMAKSEIELSKGSLPINEVLEGYEELCKHKL